MIKVLYLLNYAGKGGTEKYVYSLIEKLHDKKIKAYFAYNEEGMLVDRLKQLGVEVFKISMKSPCDIKAIAKVNSICKKLQVDIIHTHFLRENYISLLSRVLNPRVKVMYTNHIVLKNGPFLRVTNRIVTKLESQIIAVCNKGKETLIRNGINGNKIDVIFNGVDVDYWNQPINSTMRQELGIDNKTFVFLCASRFTYEKGHKFLIDAVSHLKKIANQKFKCVLANDGPLLEECKKQAIDLGLEKDIIFLGFREDVKNLVYGSDLNINSSEHEALSFAILEGLACGVPVVATDVDGNGHIVNDETNCGILVKYYDVEGLALAINSVMNDKGLQQKLGTNALQIVKDRFNIENMVDKVYKLYQNVCKD